MEGELLRDDQWERLREFVPGGRKGKRGPRSDGRRLIDALLWVGRSGGRWRDLPEKFGPDQTVKRRYYRWVGQGVLDRIFAGVADDPDLDRRDRHPCSGAGGRRPGKKGALKPRRSGVRAAASAPGSMP